MKNQILIISIIFSAILLTNSYAKENTNIPNGANGFSGMVSGKVVSKRQLDFEFTIDKIEKVWRDNRAESPKELIGKTIQVEVAWNRNRDGVHSPYGTHVHFISSIEANEKINVEIKNSDGEFQILELSELQRKRAHSFDKRSNIPFGARGFSGLLSGKVLSINDHGFYMKVKSVEKIWKNNKSEEPYSLEGRKVLVNVQWQKGEKGKWHPKPAHLKYLKTLDEDKKIEIEVINDEIDRLHILELEEERD